MVLFTLGAGRIVDVAQRVELIHYNVNIVTADTVALAGNALAFIHAGDGVELAALNLALYAVEVVGNGVHTGWVADENDTVGQLFGAKMKMET